MRTLGLVVLSTLVSSAAGAQTLKRADLLGQWREVGDTSGSYQEFRDDSTFTLFMIVPIPKDSVPPGVSPTSTMSLTGRWHLDGDTIVEVGQKIEIKVATETRYLPMPSGGAVDRFRAQSEGARLTITPVASRTVYERADGIKGGGAGPSRAATSADLTGRWVEAGDSSGYGTEFHADSTATITVVLSTAVPGGPPAGSVIATTASWLLRADTLTMVPQKTELRTPDGLHMERPEKNPQPRLQLVRLEGRRLIATAVGPLAPARVFERHSLPAPPTADSVKAPAP